jgi:hypothetical protein
MYVKFFEEFTHLLIFIGTWRSCHFRFPPQTHAALLSRQCMVAEVLLRASDTKLYKILTNVVHSRHGEDLC